MHGLWKGLHPQRLSQKTYQSGSSKKACAMKKCKVLRTKITPTWSCICNWHTRSRLVHDQMENKNLPRWKLMHIISRLTDTTCIIYVWIDGHFFVVPLSKIFHIQWTIWRRNYFSVYVCSTCLAFHARRIQLRWNLRYRDEI